MVMKELIRFDDETQRTFLKEVSDVPPLEFKSYKNEKQTMKYEKRRSRGIPTTGL